THKNGELEETDSLPALSIEKAAIQVISEVLEHGTLEQQQYAIRCTLALQGKHEELNKILEKCLKSSEPAIRNYAIDQISILSEGMFPSTALLVLENYDVLKNNLENSTKNAFSKNVAKLFISGSPLALDNLDTVSEILDIPKESILKIQEIVAGYKEKFGHLPYVDSLGDFQQILHVSKNLELSELALDLFKRNVNSDLVFRNIDMLMQQKDKVLTEIDDIQLFVPDYKYIPVIGYEGKILMPYEELSDTDIKVFVKTFEEVHRINPVRTAIAASRLMDVLSETDPLLHGLPNAEHSQETRKLFLDSLLQISASANLPENDPRQAIGKLVDNKYMLHYLARQPEKAQEVINLPETQPEFFTLIQPGGPLYSNREIVLRDIFSNGRVERRAKEISSVFTKKVPYWKQLYMFTNTRIGDALANAQTYYPISEVSGVTWTSLTQQHKTVKAENPDKASRLEGIVSNPEVIRELVEGEIDTVPFHDISGIYKKVVFRDYLRRSIETSRSSTAKEFAGERNREKTSSTFKFKPEMYIHGSRLDIIDDVLSKGNLPQEALGERSGTDSFPFQVDFSRVTTDLLNSQGNSIKEVIDKTISKNYGDGVYYVYDRTDTDWEPGKVAYGYGEGHALMLGGVPSTEIGAILLNNPEIQFDITRNAILENGMYIPVYAFDGKLLFSPEEYDQKRQDLNLDVPVELWDYSLKTGEQKGSNPGAEFTIPTKTGPEKYYVKYVERDELDHLWSEQLADNLYRILDIPVPETKIVKINNSFGHASKLLPIDDTSERPGLKEGFIADSLLANWDAVYNQGNNIASGGETYRIDNGGALQFRARGQRKEDIFFSNVTREVEFGTDRQRLGLGMRQEYPDLTDEDIKTQTTILKEKLTDDEIEKQINSVRLPSSEREMLSKVLRERRDYIIDRFSSL
nr:hypothetical protein [Candidatus Levybacteria bacterium]